MRFLVSVVGAVLGFYFIHKLTFALFYSYLGGTVCAIIGAILGLPLGVFCGILVIDLPRIGFKRYHLAGLVMSLAANAGALLLAEIMMIAQIPMTAVIVIQLLLSVAVCLWCYVESENAEKIGRDAK